MLRGLWSLAALCAGLMASGSALAQGVGYQVISNNPNGVEIRFHGTPMRAVHADDNQNALSIDFQQPVDGAMFDHLPADVPQWISMSYANFDNGIIRSGRPVTFLTRAETDGFSLRIVPRDSPPPPMMAQNAPPPPMPPAYGPVQQQIWPPPQQGGAMPTASGFHAYAD